MSLILNEPEQRPQAGILCAQLLTLGVQGGEFVHLAIGVPHTGIVSAPRANRNSPHHAEPPDEVDFWQPSAHGFRAIQPGAPFFFRLGAPHKAIAGYGFFARYERASVWLACG